jgi:NAD+ synthase
MFSRNILNIDCKNEAERVQRFIREQVFSHFKCKGAVVGLSGGIDSALVSTLCVNALGKEKVLGLILPEKESNPISRVYARDYAGRLRIPLEEIDITPHIEALGTYRARNEVLQRLFPDFDDSYKFHITLPQNLLEKDRISYHIITIQSPNNETTSKRLSSNEWHEISSAQNTKQRIRMINLYRVAEKHNYLVAGTTNKSEVAQGFYVKHGDGGVDIEPIAHLYKMQVYQLSKYLGVTDEIINRPPSPDTYSLPVTDEQFYYCMPYELADLLLYAYERHIPEDQVAETLQLSVEQIRRAFKDFKAKENATWHLRVLPPTLKAGDRV